uniref:PrdX deacylase domain-containing protein 1 n=1 Tax=Plectus sambesii TaxID=2011161 RepID=A0A914W0V7_9BILA
MPHKFLTSEELIPFLTQNGIDFECVEHEAVFTVDAMKEEMSKMPGLHYKNLFLRERKTGGFYLLVAAHDRVMNLNAVSKALRLTSRSGLRFASEEQLMEKLGVRQGSVTLLAMANDVDRCVTVLLDSTVMEQNDHLRWFHLMQNDVSAGLSLAALKKFLDLIGCQPTLLTFDSDGSVYIE